MENELDVLNNQRDIWVSNPSCLSLLRRKKGKEEKKKEWKGGKKEREKYTWKNNIIRK